MATSSGTSSGSPRQPNSASEEDPQLVMDERKRKRMQSNRESAKRSRMRKLKQMDDLMIQIEMLRKENSQILTKLSLSTQRYLKAEADNSVLRTQIMELNSRVESLNEIINFVHLNAATGFEPQIHQETDIGCMEPWNMVSSNQPIMASANIFQY